MDVNVTRLRETLKKYEHFAVYGCGDFGRQTYQMLRRMDSQPDFFLVTENKSKQSLYDGIVPICELEQQLDNIRQNNIFIIIAVSSSYKNEIEVLLRTHGIESYLAVTDLDRSSSEHLEQYKNMSEYECIKEIAEWHLDDIGDVCTSEETEIQNIKRLIAGDDREDKRILFVLGAITPRTIKIADALLEQGYEIEMLAEPGATMQKICMNELRRLNIPCTECASAEELMYHMIAGKSKTIHLFTHRGESHLDRILIKMKMLFPPIVYDEYDIISIGYKNEPKDLMDNERYCLEHADAICNRGYEIDYLKEACGFQIGARCIQFPDYCSRHQCDEIIYDGDKLSFCYVGGLVSKSEYPDLFGFFEEFAKMCAVNKCHFHVYPHIWNEERWKAYLELDNENDYFHMHMPVPNECLNIEIAKYDYGIFPWKKQGIEKGVAYNTKEKVIYATTNKYFDYLDAGLPVIAGQPLKLVKFLEEKGVAINWFIEDFNFEELRRRKKELKEKVLIKRKELQMRNHIHELIAIYDAI
jgi:hypothetical protein